MGLDIGTSGVRAAEIRRSGKGPRLERFGQVALPPGAVRDGEVVDPAAVAEALRELWSRTRFSSKRVVVGVANQKVVVRQVDLPALPLAELRSSLAFTVQDHIPMPVDQAILDFHPLEEVVGDTGAPALRVLLVAAARGMVDGTLVAVQAAGLRPTMVDLTGFALLRAQAHVLSGLATPTAEALVDVGAGVTNVVVHQGGVPRFVRILLMGGDDMTGALAERLGVAVPQAEEIKQRTGLAPVQGGADPSPVARAIEATGSAFVEEVRGSLDYYAAQSGAARIDRVVLSGGGSRLSGLAERLAAATRRPVETAHPLALLALGRTGLTPEQLADAEPSVSVSVGLALGAAS